MIKPYTLMLKEFWEEKKHIIQMVGILTAIGALFLSVPLPDDQKARLALRHIQFFWLIIISISVTGLLLNLWSLLRLFEKEIKERRGINLDETLTLIMSGGLLILF